LEDHFIQIYKHQAEAYHRLIAPEDVEGNLRPALERVTSLRGKRVLDLGTGTGRLPLLFGQETAQMICLDLHTGMLQEHQRQRDQQQGPWSLIQGDMRRLPIPTAWAEVVTAGWALGHFTGWYGEDWLNQANQVLQEMHRVVTPEGAIIILETLTTGSLTPAPPTPGLAQYYRWLEESWGFTRQEVQTDYQFADVEEAARQTEFFFGPGLATTIREKGWSRLPEWTGVWGKRK
jgi:ubiquinone/menaquinone biosynthesis C-methylase UbiE